MLPPEVKSAFDGNDLESQMGLGYVVATVDEDGSPRPSMLSAGEILALDDVTLRLALWPDTNTGRNLADRGSFLLCYVGRGVVCYVRGTAHKLHHKGQMEVEAFEIEVTSTEEDQHPGLPTNKTITFDCVGIEEATLLKEWRARLSWLRDPEA
jgi:hypothetical protein